MRSLSRPDLSGGGRFLRLSPFAEAGLQPQAAMGPISAAFDVCGWEGSVNEEALTRFRLAERGRRDEAA